MQQHACVYVAVCVCKPERASEVHEAMQKQRPPPDVIAVSASISACAQGMRPERALELFEAMRKHQLTPNVITYSASISACVKT